MIDPNATPEALQAHLLARLIAATARPGETAAEAGIRAALIVQAFQAMRPADALEAMRACHVLSLQFACENAVEALSAPPADGDWTAHARTQTRLRSQINSLSRTLGQWSDRYRSDQARREKREADEAAGQRTAASRTAVSRTAASGIMSPTVSGSKGKGNDTPSSLRVPERALSPPVAEHPEALNADPKTPASPTQIPPAQIPPARVPALDAPASSGSSFLYINGQADAAVSAPSNG